LPVALATGTATFIGRLYFGLEPAFRLPALATMSHRPSLNLSIPAFAIVGMAAMVGGGTGAAMTAVTMIFEMTRDYDIVMPMIIAVAISIGI
jgi:chloride channel protein, CIC family